jgi:hypothetical protein
LLQDYLGRKFRFVQVRIDENACKAEQKDIKRYFLTLTTRVCSSVLFMGFNCNRR